MGENWVYVLSCENGVIYVGETERLFKRLSEHCNKKGSKVTQKNKPLRLLSLYKVSENFDKEEFHNVDIKKLNTSLEYNIFRLMEAHHGNLTYGASHCKMIDNITYKRNLYEYHSRRPYCFCQVPCEYQQNGGLWLCSLRRHNWITSPKYEEARKDIPEDFLWKTGGCEYRSSAFITTHRDSSVQTEPSWLERHTCCG